MRNRFLAFITVLLLLIAGTAYAGTMERVSLDSNGNQVSYGGIYPDVSDDGELVTFQSFSDELVSDDTNETADIFVRDRVTGETIRVSVDSSGSQSNAHSGEPSISADGRYVAFSSDASNLVSGDTNGYTDIFVHDLSTGATVRVNVASDGSQGTGGGSDMPDLSDDGRYVVFASYATNLINGVSIYTRNVYLHDRDTDNDGVYDETGALSTTVVSVDSYGTISNLDSRRPVISADGRYVVFESESNNLVPNDTNGAKDVFLHDTSLGSTIRVSVDSSGGDSDGDSWMAAISPDGGYVSFESSATDLVSGDTNGKWDIFIRDLSSGTTERVSVDSNENQSNGDTYYWSSVSDFGNAIAFGSHASNLVNGVSGDNIYLRDRTAGETEVISLGNGNSHGAYPRITPNERFIVFASSAQLVPEDTTYQTDVYIYDRFDDDGDGFAYYDDCDDTNPDIYPGATEILNNGTDEDCNGYDLTIQVTSVSYNTGSQRLIVEADSYYGSGTYTLTIEGYGDMTWNGSSYDYSERPVADPNGSITVTGLEGSVVATY